MMEDEQIISLYWERDERASLETSQKYGGYCHTIYYNIVASAEDAEECVNETWLRTWNSVPPSRPVVLPPFLARIVRNLSIDRVRRSHAARRSGYTLALDELSECTASEANVEAEFDARELASAVNRFLHRLPERECGLFLERYFYMRSVEEDAQKWSVSANYAAVLLHRTRKKLHTYLKKSNGVMSIEK